MMNMKVIHFFAVAILSTYSFCSGNSVPAEVKDAMVRNHRAHVVRLTPFINQNNIQPVASVLGSGSSSQNQQLSEQDYKILTTSVENQRESGSSEVTASIQGGEDLAKLSVDEPEFQQSVFLFSSPSLLYQMIDSISRIQFLFMHSLGSVPSPSSEESKEENATSESEEMDMDGENEAQSISLTNGISSDSGSGSSPCMHHLRGSIGGVESSESFLPMFLFFSSPFQFFTASSFNTKKGEEGLEDLGNRDDDYWLSIDMSYFQFQSEEGDDNE